MNSTPVSRARRPCCSHAPILYFLVALCLAWQLLVPGYTLFRWDTVLYLWPLLREAKAQILSGHLPFWTSSIGCGTDLLANVNAGLLYPPRVLIWLLPLRLGYHLFLFLHVWLALLGMHVFVRRGLRLSFFAGFVAALAYGASGYARAMWDSTNFVALPWIPLGFAAVLLARQRGAMLTAVLAVAGCAAMLILGGDLQAAVLWVPAALGLALCLPGRTRTVAAWAAGLGLAILLTAPQWLPSLHAASLSSRAGGMDMADAAERSFHPLRILELLVPHAFGTHGNWMAPALMGDAAAKRVPWTASFHVGILSLIPLAFSWRKRHRPTLYWALVVFFLGLALSFGRFLPGFGWWIKVPLIRSFRYPEKYLLWATLALSVQAAYGAGVLRAVWRKEALRTIRVRTVLVWLTVVIAGTGTTFWVLHAVADPAYAASRWFAGRMAGVAAIATLVVTAAALPRRWRGRLVLAGLFLAGAIVPWYGERPLTRRWDPTVPPPFAQAVRRSAEPFGRIAVDYALAQIPLPDGWSRMPGPEQRAAFMTSRLDYNSARMWGLRTVNGFSPFESRAMQVRRTPFTTPNEPSTTDAFSLFCRLSGARWIFTTAPRAARLMADMPDAVVSETWGDAGPVVLLERRRASEGLVTSGRSGSPAPVLLGLYRIYPGTLRVDLHPGEEAMLMLAETYAPGWEAVDELGNPLAVFPVHDAFLGVSVPAGTLQVRLRYVPVGWRYGLIAALAGGLIAALVVAAALGRRVARLLAHPACVIITGIAVFVVLGLSARAHWGCTYDEGFHLTRGIARLLRSDSRLNYYHPPLQNLFCAWYAVQAHGDQLRFPEQAGWEKADVQQMSVDLTFANRDVYPRLVQAARWGSLLLGCLLAGTVILWAWRAAGATAAWVAAAGMALNPSLLAHANLTTTDIGVTAMATWGSYLLWRYHGRKHGAILLWAGIAFVLAAMMKFSGLIWLAAFLFLCLPALALHQRSWRPLLPLPVTLACAALFVLHLYTYDMQVVRIEAPAWLAGKSVVAGRFFEGLWRQGSHVLDGHRSYFAGRHFTRGSWVYVVLNFFVKTPTVWVAALAVASAWAGCLAYRKRIRLIPFLPMLTFGTIFLLASRMALGVRHLLPFVPFMVLGVAVMIGRMTARRLRVLAASLVAAASLTAVAGSYPDFLSYFPFWAGGTQGGHHWAVDSNYDWGQDIKALEAEWGGLTRRNDGVPPHLLYFGFVDPRVVYHLTVCRPSWCGYMDAFSRAQGEQDAIRAWLGSLNTIEGLTVAGISMLRLKPFGVDLGYIERGVPEGRIGRTLFVRRLAGKDERTSGSNSMP